MEDSLRSAKSEIQLLIDSVLNSVEGNDTQWLKDNDPKAYYYVCGLVDAIGLIDDYI